MEKKVKDFLGNYGFEKSVVLGKECYVTCLRVPDESVPEGLFKYDVREDDYGFPWGCLEKNVLVNHSMTIVFNEELVIPDCGYIEFPQDSWEYMGAVLDLCEEYVVTEKKSEEYAEYMAEDIDDVLKAIKDRNGLEKIDEITKNRNNYTLDEYIMEILHSVNEWLKKN